MPHGMGDDKADELRRKAQECLNVAQRMAIGDDRARMLEMAQRFLKLAADADAKKPKP
jgi:hypothetical protein